MWHRLFHNGLTWIKKIFSLISTIIIFNIIWNIIYCNISKIFQVLNAYSDIPKAEIWYEVYYKDHQYAVSHTEVYVKTFY